MGAAWGISFSRKVCLAGEYLVNQTLSPLITLP
jgi:hypothetical protein